MKAISIGAPMKAPAEPHRTLKKKTAKTAA